MGALSPGRGPSLRIRRYPPGRSAYRGPISAKSLAATSRSVITAITWRFSWSPPFLAFVMSDSASGRSSFARDTVVTMPSAAKRWAAMLAIINRWCWGLPARRGPFFGAGMVESSLFLDPEGQAALVELLDDLLERLLAEVGDGQQIVLGPLDQLADGVDLGPLEAVAGPFREVELFDRQVQVERRR